MKRSSDISGNYSYDDLETAFLAEKRVRVRLSTYHSYEHITAAYIHDFFQGRPLSEITPLLIRQWQNRILMLDLSSSYLHLINSALSAMFSYGVRFFGLGYNPVTLAGSIGSTKRSSINFWTLDQFMLFIHEVKNPLKKLAFETLYWTGMRRGELLALWPEDLDFVNNTISVNKTFSARSREGIYGPPKTPKSRRLIYVNTSLMEELKNYLVNTGRIDSSGSLTSDANDLSCSDSAPDKRIFTMSPHALEYEIEKVTGKTGLPYIRIHDLRHSHASLLIELGITPLLISERLGHENVETTLKIYSHLYPSKQQQLAGRLEDIYIPVR